MKSKILLVTSSFEDIPLVPTAKTNEESHYPVGMAYLHSYIESKNIEVETLCLNHDPYEICFRRVIEKVEQFQPQVVGFQMLTSNRVSTYRLIEYLHEKYPLIKIVTGGIHTTIMWKQLVERYPFLICVLGEGEKTIIELFFELKKKKPLLKKINGIGFYANGKATRTAPRELIEDLDELPFPKHELFFKNSKRYSGCLLTSRGCYFACSFCCLNPESKRIVRFRSPKNVVDEIEYMTDKFPKMTEIFIHDDSFFIDNNRVIEICDEIIKRKIKMNFVCSGRVKPLSEEMISKLEQANFTRVMVGMESGDDRILKLCQKGINQKDIENAFRLFSKSKINLKTFFIIGLPGEDLNSINETAKFVKKMQKIKYISYGDAPNFLMIYPGTEVYEIAKSKNFIDDDFWLSDREIPLYTVENSYEELDEFSNILLDNICFKRIITWKGFVSQFEMIPYLLKYFLIRIKEKANLKIRL